MAVPSFLEIVNVVELEGVIVKDYFSTLCDKIFVKSWVSCIWVFFYLI